MKTVIKVPDVYVNITLLHTGTIKVQMRSCAW